MRKVLLRLFVLSFCLNANAQTAKIDTLYYDRDWKAAVVKEFADYYRLAFYPADKNQPNKMRDYYITGELRGEGEFITIDKNDDSKSVFNGEVVGYHKNGKMAYTYNYKNGVPNGKFTTYGEDGFVITDVNMVDGKYDGIYTIFNEDGSYMQSEYENGNMKYDYYIYVTMDGNASKLSVKTDEIMWDQLSVEDRKSEYRDGVNWQYYNQNGLHFALSSTEVKDFGKWHKVEMIIANNTVSPIEFNPEDIDSYMINKANVEETLKVWTREEFTKKVDRTRLWTAIGIGVAEGVAIGLSTIPSKSKSTTVIDAPGHAKTKFTTTTTSSYDSYAVYQASALALTSLMVFENTKWRDRSIKDEGYLRRTTIQPGETISGYVYVERKPGMEVFYKVPLCGVTYDFSVPSMK